MKKTKSISLRFTQGSSDKVYHAAIEKVMGGYAVNYSYGRYGSTLTVGSKTQEPVPQEEAEKIYTKLVQEKMGKGYQEVASSGGDHVLTTAPTTAKTPRADVACMLLTAIEGEQGAACVLDPDYATQEKFDGKRIILVADLNGITAYNRKGLACGIAERIVEAATKLRNKYGRFTLDGEAIGQQFVAFDCLELAGEDQRPFDFKTRDRSLTYLLRNAVPGSPIRQATTAHTQADKRKMLEHLISVGAEGIVFKRVSQPYRAGRQKDQFKHKFYATASFIVSSINKQRSVNITVLQDGVPVEVGRCSIPPNKQVPEADTVIEVRYLHVFRGGRVYQPVYIGVRDDLDKSECTIEQLKFKAEVEEI